MKRVRRRPSLRIHMGTMVVSALVLTAFSLWFLSPTDERLSRAYRWADVRYFGGDPFRGYGFVHTCYILVDGDRFQVLGDGTRPTDEVMTQHEQSLYVYSITTTKIGLFAPTTLSLWHGIDRPYLEALGSLQEFLAVSDRWGLGLAPDEDGYMTIDPRLRSHFDLPEERTLYSGYVINAAVLMALIGLPWALLWTPIQIRYQITKRRQQSGLCPKCKYDMRAAPGRCPECGWSLKIEDIEIDLD